MRQPEPFGKFLLYGQVAVGGMAEIYKGRYKDQSAPQFDIAVKRILPSYTEDQGFVTMFKDEGNIALRLKHPNIVSVYEVGEVNNDWYIAMEFVHGTDLRVLSDVCEKNRKRFTFTQVARIICDTAKALDYAHKSTDENGECLNIVHRDCTPHNIMVSYDGQIKLMDFGIAKAASRATKTRAGTVKGKSSYMSPEQARGRNLDGRSDMFTLGTVGWELLTECRLFKGSNDMEAIGKILKSVTPHPSDLDSNIPRDLGDIILRTLEKDRDMRYKDCGELANALETFIQQKGDGSDKQLGLFVQAILSKNGHSPSEIPNYVPGNAIIEIDDQGNFKQKAVAPAPAAAGLMSVQPAPAAQAFQQQQTVQPSYPQIQPGMPSGSFNKAPDSALPPQRPIGMIVGSVVLFLVTAFFVVLGLLLGPDEKHDDIAFSVPNSTFTFSSSFKDTTISINGEKLDGRSYKAKVGDQLEITFEKDGYESVTIKREARLLEHKITDDNVKLLTKEQARLAKLTSLPELVINTDPAGAKVTINGEDKGTSPVKLENIDFGEELKIEVVADGYESKTTTIVANRHTEPSTNIALVATTVVAKDTKSPKASKPKAPSKPKAAATSGSGTGSLTVKAVPWATVSIDGARVGNTPITGRKLKTGSHKVELNLPNKQKKVHKTVTIKSDQTTSITYNFNTDAWQ